MELVVTDPSLHELDDFHPVPVQVRQVRRHVNIVQPISHKFYALVKTVRILYRLENPLLHDVYRLTCDQRFPLESRPYAVLDILGFGGELFIFLEVLFAETKVPGASFFANS